MSITITFTDLSRDDLSRIAVALSVRSGDVPEPTVRFPIISQPDDDISDEDDAMLDTLAGIPNAAELDAAGLPWNAEEHASTRTKTKDGLWKKRKVFSNSAEASDVPSPPVVPLPPVPPPVQQQLTYPEVVTRIMDGVTRKQFEFQTVVQHLASFNISNITALEHRPDVFAALLGKLGV
jgi:hypothetical protein